MNRRPVALICLPWLEPRQAPLGLAVVSSLATVHDIPTVTFHPNIEFWQELADTFGEETARFVFSHDEVGEVIAASIPNPGMDRLQGGDPQLSSLLTERDYPEELFWDVADRFRDFTDRWFTKTDVSEFAAVGFTLTIAQTATSLHWARQVKSRHRDIPVLFGGSQCEDPMGLALFDACHEIDILVRGEADSVIGPLFTALSTGHDGMADRLAGIAGIAYRAGGNVVTTPRNLVAAPPSVIPDYAAFSRSYHALRDSKKPPANYYMEGSRGCWWGEKRQCTFCGIHTTGIAFRAKPASAVAQEARLLLQGTRGFRIAFSDTIMATEHLDNLLPELQALADAYYVEFITDVKNSLRKDQVYALARAGFVSVQIGIESLSTRLLQLMRKGNSALQQVRAIKWCTEAGISPYYHLLTHVPEELPSDYADSLRLARSISHLPPPSGVFPIELNRYAPYFEKWRDFGFDPPVPATYYRLMFRETDISVDDFAYRFEGRHPSTLTSDLDQARRALIDFTETTWRTAYDTTSLTYRHGERHLELRRTTSEGIETLLLEEPWVQVYLALDAIRGLPSLMRDFPRLRQAALRDWLESMCDRGYILQDNGRYLALAIRELNLRPHLPAEPPHGNSP